MARYPGNHIDSELLNVPRRLKTRPGAPETHLSYITDDEADQYGKLQDLPEGVIYSTQIGSPEKGWGG